MELIHTSPVIVYIRALYWSAATLFLVGPAPTNWIEEGATILLLIIAVGLFAYFLSKISEIIADLN